ncbi:D-methionine transport system permease protein [Ruminococcaceae bacterium R-25]|nr:ABC transporter permease [Clostridiales bacterium]MBR3462834.1 ABC transporter permease [Clostridiales bacterium]PWJ71060.1 D-methionine transport system permease protein [Ruminococcaceae bacterium R-25]SUQ11539.1 D-methionine transport system permease protein [Oscillospiraceae bacterium]
MSLLDSSFWEVFLASLSPEIWKDLWGPIGETLYMTAISSVIMLVFGIVIGILLDITNPNGLIPLKLSYTLSGWMINCLRSLPQMIMIILMIPVARLIFGKSYGTNACIIAIAASCIPMYARIVESSLLEIDKGKIEAAQAMGSKNISIIFKVLLPETLPSLIRGFTVSVITVLSMTALAGMFGAGGIGDIAVRYGYQRFQHDRLFACVYILIVLVQLIQGIGNLVSKRILKTRNLV